jgi:hypothetical protein
MLEFLNWRKEVLKIFLALCGAIIAPLIISLLLKIELFSFSEGNVESWIAFWGSYVGALIGAGTVYFVTNLQVKEQRKLQILQMEKQKELQIESIKIEHDNALKREMKQFHFKNQIEKIEELQELLENTLITITQCSNDFTKYISCSYILNEDNLSDKDKEDLRKTCSEYFSESYNWMVKLNKALLNITRISYYIEGHAPQVEKLAQQLSLFINEFRAGYADNDSYKKYDLEKVPLGQHTKIFTELISQISSETVLPLLKKKISEMNEKSGN